MNEAAYFYINKYIKIGKNIAGIYFITFNLVTLSIFIPRPIINNDPTQVISAITISLKYGEINCANNVILP